MTDEIKDDEQVKKEFTPEITKDIDTTEISNNIESQAAAIVDAIPEVTESAIHVHNETEQAINDLAAGKVDKNGDSFDTSKHQVDSDGNPKISAGGKLMLKRGRKAGGTTSKPHSKVSTGATQPMQVLDQQGLTEGQRQQAAVSGKVSASLLINVSMMVGGSEFAPAVDKNHNIDEKVALESAFTDYFVATGKTDIPPNVALMLTVGMYILPRLTMPTVQTKLKAKGGKIYTWWQNRKLKKLAKKAKPNGTQSNTGNDGKRENDTSETTSANLQK